MTKPARRFENLSHAIVDGTVDDVRQLLAAGADPNEIEEEGDVTPLMTAASLGDLAIVTALVEAAADANALAEDFSGDMDEFDFLVEAYEAAEIDGLTALICATLRNHAEVAAYLSDRTDARLRAQAELLADWMTDS